jgi:hypothetical protein
MKFRNHFEMLRGQAKRAAPADRAAVLREMVALCEETTHGSPDESELSFAYESLAKHLESIGERDEAMAITTRQIDRYGERLAAIERGPKPPYNALHAQQGARWLYLAQLRLGARKTDEAIAAYRAAFDCFADFAQRNDQLRALLESWTAVPLGARDALLEFLRALCAEHWPQLRSLEAIGALAIAWKHHATARAALSRVVAARADKLDQPPRDAKLAATVVRLAGLCARDGDDTALAQLLPSGLIARGLLDKDDAADAVVRDGLAALATRLPAVPDSPADEGARGEAVAIEDPNLKLALLSTLMDLELIPWPDASKLPKPDAEDLADYLAELEEEREPDEDDEASVFNQPAANALLAIPLTDTLLNQLRELEIESGGDHRLTSLLYPQWHGEDELFTVGGLAGLEHCKNLTALTLPNCMVADLAAVTALPRLSRLHVSWSAETPRLEQIAANNRRHVDTLRARGVIVDVEWP